MVSCGFLRKIPLFSEMISRNAHLIISNMHVPMHQCCNHLNAKDYSLYVAASLSTIGMVLVQTYEHDQEHVIYYASKSLQDSET